MMFKRYPVNDALVGDRDGFAGRDPNPAFWRREAYRRGYAQGLLTRAERIAQGALPLPVARRSVAEVRQ